MIYNFYRNNDIRIKPINNDYIKIKDQYHLYEILNNLWCKNTCAKRLQNSWNVKNKALGQCSISAFLASDIFGGEVYGILLDDGNYHCFNKIGNNIFDLTSSQFNFDLNYDNSIIQNRDDHFKKKEKYDRYLYLKSLLIEYLNNDLLIKLD